MSRPCSSLRRTRSSPVASRLGRAGQAPVRVEAGADERLVGEVRAGEQAGDPVQEGGLGERAGRREEAVDGPLDAVGERHGGELAVGLVGQPPAVVADPGQAPALRARERRPRQGRGAGRRGPRRAGAGTASGRRGPGGLAPPRPSVCRGAVAGGAAAGRGAAGARCGRGPRGSRPGAPRSETGSPRSLRTSTAASTTARSASSAENGALAPRSGGANRRSLGLVVRVARAARDGWQRDVRPGPRAAGHGARARRDQLHGAAGVTAGLGQPGAGHAEPGRHAAQRARDERLRAVALEQEHDPRVAAQDRLDGAQAAGDRRRLPAPGRAHRRPEQRLQRQRRGGIAAERPGGAVVRPGQALGDRAEGRRAEGKPDARPDAQARPGGGPRGRARRAPRASPASRRPSPRPRRGCAGRLRAGPARDPRRRSRGAG